MRTFVAHVVSRFLFFFFFFFKQKTAYEIRISDWSSDVCSSDLLKLHKELSAPEIYLLQGKVDALIATWDQKLEAHQKRSAIATGKETADEMTTEALARLETLYSILAHTLKLDDRVDWETLKERTPFAGDPRFPAPEPPRRTTPEQIGTGTGRE